MCAAIHLDQLRDVMDAVAERVRDRLNRVDGWADDVEIIFAQETLEAAAFAVNLLARDSGLRVSEVRVDRELRRVGWAIGDHRVH